MAYSSAEARQQLLDGVAEAADTIGFALASLGAAYEQLDDYSGATLEEELFRPVQMAYGRLKRTYTEFAARHGLSTRTFEAQAAGLPSIRARGFIDSAVQAVREADGALAALQDSPRLVEVGDLELRAGLVKVRELLSGLPQRAREIVRTLGR